MTINLPILNALRQTMIQEVPAYANKFIYSLGFLSMLCFVVLIITGTIMAVFGPDWWLTNSTGHYLRSVHLWATQAFMVFVILHLMIVFFGSGFKNPRRLTWVIGALMFFFVLAEAEFGYVLRGDFSSQWRSLQGADLYNGTGIGYWLNNINYRQIYGIHIVVVPLLILGLLFMHYLLVRYLGIAKPYRKDVQVETVKANHTVLFARGGVLVGLILLLALVFPSPFLKPDTIKNVAQQDPQLVGQTLMKEFDRSSDTATYLDNIDPYKFDTRQVFVTHPYEQLYEIQSAKDSPSKSGAIILNLLINPLDSYTAEPSNQQAKQLKQAEDYYNNTYPKNGDQLNPLEVAINQLISMAQSGAYEASLNQASTTGDQTTYTLRFLADTGVMDSRAQALGITTEQYGMLSEESGHLPPGAWWLAPIGVLNHTLLANDDNGDRDGAIIIGVCLLVLIALPYIPGLNRLPEVFRLNKLIWRTGKSQR